MGTDRHQHRPTMFTLAILSILAGLAASAPQSRIIPEANTYGTQVIGTGQTQGSQTIQYGYDNALAGLNFLNTGLQSTNTFGAATATNGLTAATNTATFGSSVAPFGLQDSTMGSDLANSTFGARSGSKAAL